MNAPAPVVPPAKPPVADPKVAGKPGAPVVPPAKPEEPAAPQTYEVKVGDEVLNLTAEQIHSLKGKADQFDLTAKAKAELEKGLANVLSRIEVDPLELYEKRGKDRKKYIVEEFKKLVEQDQMDPKERELADLRREKEERLKKDQDAEKAVEAEKQKAERQKQYVEILKSIDAALTKKGLAKDHITLDRMLRIMASGKRVRGQTFTALEAAEIFEREEIKHLGFIAKQLPSERLKELFGPDFIKKLNGEQIQQLKAADKKTIQANKEAAADAGVERAAVSAEERRRQRNATAGI